MRESAVEKYFIKRIEAAGWVQYKNSPDHYAGIPDRTIMKDGRGEMVELKTVGGRLSPLQKVVHEELRASGVPVHVIWTKEQVDEFIETL